MFSGRPREHRHCLECNWCGEAKSRKKALSCPVCDSSYVETVVVVAEAQLGRWNSMNEKELLAFLAKKSMVPRNQVEILARRVADEPPLPKTEGSGSFRYGSLLPISLERGTHAELMVGA